jgi:hypothetical protein
MTYQRFQPRDARRLRRRFVGDPSRFGPPRGAAPLEEPPLGKVGTGVLESGEGLKTFRIAEERLMMES